MKANKEVVKLRTYIFHFDFRAVTTSKKLVKRKIGDVHSAKNEMLGTLRNVDGDGCNHSP